ncbi:caspase family protein [Methylobacterium cerastii]|nr:caspase family protein [Methylobacterium cerastii]
MFAADPVLAAPRERRVALVIGNSAYARFPSLPNPRNDAEDVTAALKRAGFEVMGGTDLSREAIRDQLRLFARAAQGADAALAYYAGHGLQYKGRNYIVPVDAKLQDEFDLEYETVRVDDVVGELNRAEGARILVLDACRNLPLKEKSARNPFADTGLAKISGRGLVVAYATQANALAYDGTGRNSIFSSAFLRVIDEPGLDLPQFFQRVSIAVDKQSGGRQTPELSLSYPGQFFINRSETDRDVWRRIREATDPALFRDFLKQYPGSDLADAAASRLARLDDAFATRQRQPDEWAALKLEQARRVEAARARREEEAEAVRRGLAEEKAAEDRRVAEQARVAEELREKRLAEDRAAEARRLAETARISEAARRKSLAEERAAEARRVAEHARAAEETRRRALAEEKAAEDQRMAEQARAAEETRLAHVAEERAAESRRVADRMRAAEEARQARIAEEKAAEDRRMTEQARAAEEARLAHVAEERAAEARRVADRMRVEEEARQARITQEKAAEGQRLAEKARAAEERAAETRRLAEQTRAVELARAAEETRRKVLAEEKAAEDRRVAEQAHVAEERAVETRRLVEQERAAEAARIDLARAAPEAPAPLGRFAALDAKAPVSGNEPEPRAVAVGNSRMAYNEPRAPLPDAKPPVSAFPAETLDKDRLHREAEAELGRIGCFEESADATWNVKSRSALANYALHAKLTPVPTEPTPDLLRDLKLKPAHFCPLACGPGTKAHGDACIAVEKPQPVARKPKPKPEPDVVEKARPKPQREAVRPRPQREAVRPRPEPAQERPKPRREAVQPRPRPAPVAVAPRPAAAPPQAPVSTAARPMQRPMMGVGF